MKLTTLAIAVAAASLTMSANAADLKFGGDFHVGYKSDRDRHLEDFGSELWLNISEKAGGLTYFAHAELEFDGGVYDGADDNIEVDELQVGVSGAFGKIIAGDIDNACDKLEVGGDWNEFLAASDSRGDCGSTDAGTILYTKKYGKSEFGVSHNVENDESSVAVRYKHSKNLSLALGHVQNKGDKENVTSASVTAKMGKFGLKARVNDYESSDADLDGGYSVFASYQATKNDNFNIGTDSDETVSIGYNRKLSKSSKLFIEAREQDGKSAEHAIGVQYKF